MTSIRIATGVIDVVNCLRCGALLQYDVCKKLNPEDGKLYPICDKCLTTQHIDTLSDLCLKHPEKGMPRRV